MPKPQHLKSFVNCNNGKYSLLVKILKFISTKANENQRNQMTSKQFTRFNFENLEYLNFVERMF